MLKYVITLKKDCDIKICLCLFTDTVLYTVGMHQIQVF